MKQLDEGFSSYLTKSLSTNLSALRKILGIYNNLEIYRLERRIRSFTTAMADNCVCADSGEPPTKTYLVSSRPPSLMEKDQHLR